MSDSLHPTAQEEWALARTQPEEFRARYAKGCLLYDAPLAPAAAVVLTAVSDGPAPGGSKRVAAVGKRPSNPFALMITLGRAKNNDVFLPCKGISKFHCYLNLRGERLELVDASSTCGTFLDGHQLEPNAPGVPLKSGSEIRLGHLLLRYVPLEEMWDTLRRS